jgi:carbon-monoxide dehydrogenase large subunit
MNAPVSKQKGARFEDENLLRGHGRFSDDLREPNTTFACFVRSPYAFAKIIRINSTAAKKMAGVISVLTGADLSSSGYKSVTAPYPLHGCERVAAPYRPALAGDRVMHVGEAVAVVIAETFQQAQDAADQVDVEFEQLAAAANIAGSLSAGASQLWSEAEGNIALDYRAPADPVDRNEDELDRCFAVAAHVATVNLTNQRLAAISIEPRVATAFYDANKDLLTLRCGSQGVAAIRGEVCTAMQLPLERVRVLTHDVGGGFGMKASSYPEYIVLLHAARLLGRPVHWVSTRMEAFQTDNQARDSIWRGELALNQRGQFLGLRVDVISNIGAYLTGVGHYCATRHVAECLPGIYDIPLVNLHTRCVFTNCAPVGPYRGAGRPEANYFLERLVDKAAEISGIDPAELRRKNLIAADRMPLTTALGNSYDSGDFPEMFEAALKAADYLNFAARRKISRNAGRLRGIGIGCYLENAGAYPEEAARISFLDNHQISVSIGAGSTGQGHQTVFRELVADRLGVSPNVVVISSGDSDRDIPGFGAVASRTAMMVGGAIANATDAVIAKGSDIAALLLQSDRAAIEYRSGIFHNKDSKQSLTLFDVAARARELARQRVIAENLDTTASVKAPASFPNGCHVAEIEIDSETGTISIVSYIAVDDCGKVLNPMIVEGQFHGGVVQGLGQALCESVIYDGDSGQLNSGSFMDYGVPRASSVPAMTVHHREVVCTTNPLGVKGAGESGTTAAPCAIMNAIIHAMPADAAALLEMPATPDRVWRALQKTPQRAPTSQVQQTS